MPSDLKPVAEFGDQLRPFQFEGEAPMAFDRERGDMGLARYAGFHAGFLGWLMAVDRRVRERTSVGLLDLPDTTLRDQYDQGCHPHLAADDAIEEVADEFNEELDD